MIQQNGAKLKEYASDEINKLNHLELSNILSAYPHPELDDEVLIKIDEYDNDPFILKFLILRSKECRSAQVAIRSIQKILEALIEIMLTTLDGMDDNNMPSRIENNPKMC